MKNTLKKTYYIAQLYDFLDSLARNNNREWFQQHKSLYTDLRQQWLADLDRLIALMSSYEPRLQSTTAAESVYRINRDVRFSPDKRPYKTFFSASISPYGKKSMHAGYYIEIGNAVSYDQGLYAGLWCPDAPTLKKLRHAIVDNIEEWEEIVNSPEMMREFPEWCCNSLKTIPKGWDKNHPQAEYLRMTSYGKFHPCGREFFLNPDWVERSAEMFSVLQPFVGFLNYSIDE